MREKKDRNINDKVDSIMQERDMLKDFKMKMIQS